MNKFVKLAPLAVLVLFGAMRPAQTESVSKNGKPRAAVALVYAGPGACEEKCVSAAARVAYRTGLRIRYVTPEILRPELFHNAVAWIHPGGDAIITALLLTAEQKRLVREFVFRGGAYLGFCAGAFMADSKVDDANTVDGFGLIPGTTRDYRVDYEPIVLSVEWRGTRRHLYFEEGGWFDLPRNATELFGVQVWGRYETGHVAALEVPFGRGTVVASFPHPEAPPEWFEADDLHDLDGPDFHLADQMLMHALSRSN